MIEDDEKAKNQESLVKRGRGRPRWKTTEEKMVSRQVYMTQREWNICQQQGNASALLRFLVGQFLEKSASQTSQDDDTQK